VTPTSATMILLHHGVPITLLCDLASLADPDSAAINSVERPDRDPIWLEAARTVVARLRAESA
jgi:hypothetical protein